MYDSDTRLRRHGRITAKVVKELLADMRSLSFIDRFETLTFVFGLYVRNRIRRIPVLRVIAAKHSRTHIASIPTSTDYLIWLLHLALLLLIYLLLAYKL